MWTEETRAFVRERWADGQSASEISSAVSDRFGVRKTRNAIIGYIHRAGLSRNAPPSARAVQAAHARAAVRARRERAAKPRKVKTPPLEPMSLRKALILSLEPLNDSTRVDAIARRQCRFIHGDPAKQWAFCGRTKQAGSPYCEHHTQLCYVVKQKREQGKVA